MKEKHKNITLRNSITKNVTNSDNLMEFYKFVLRLRPSVRVKDLKFMV